MNKTIETTEPTMPHLPEVEKVILGAILEGHKTRAALLEQMGPQDYFMSEHEAIAGAIQQLHSKGRAVDLLSVQTELSRTEKMTIAGGIGYLASLCNGIPAGLKLEHHIRALKDRAALRAVIRAANAIKQRAFEASEDANTLLDCAIEDFSAIARESAADEDHTISYRDASAALLSNLEKSDSLRIHTDLSGLDELTGGFRAGELVVFTGGTGHGKTLLVQQTRRRACTDGYHSLFCSGEMLAPQLLARELAANAHVKPSKMRLPHRLTEQDWHALVAAASHQCTRCQILDRELALAMIRRVARRLKGREGLELLIVDYDELVTAPGKDEFEQQRNIVRGLKSLAMELSCVAILVSQLRKPLTGEDARRPTLAGLYGSGAKAKHASCVVFVDRPFVRDLKGDETEARVIVLKHRDGRVGRVEATFNIETLRFETPAIARHSSENASERTAATD
jgi:replicative DNA helicase